MEYKFGTYSIFVSPCNGRTYIGMIYNGVHHHKFLNESYKENYGDLDLQRFVDTLFPELSPLRFVNTPHFVDRLFDDGLYGVIKCQFNAQFPYVLTRYISHDIHYLLGVMFALNKSYHHYLNHRDVLDRFPEFHYSLIKL